MGRDYTRADMVRVNMGMGASARRRTGLVVAVASVLAGAAGTAAWWHSNRLPKRFALVADGRLYRSGEVTPGQLERLQREYRIGRVISLLDPDAPVSKAERATAQRLGLVWHNVPLRGSGESTAADRRRILDLLTDPDAPPTLVHCAAGVNRTGLAIGLYRLRCQGWTLEQVLTEMRAFGFEDLPKHENLRQALAAEAAADPR